MNKTIINNIRICINAVNDINITTTKKAGYHSIYHDIKKVFDYSNFKRMLQLYSILRS